MVAWFACIRCVGTSPSPSTIIMFLANVAKLSAFADNAANDIVAFTDNVANDIA